ncbi:hypothetical protein BN134_1147 [Cronobacter dublinensis 1210]|uniref:Uncharacterized protein n=1 Tax=Cronobacter dublinensis 1210 TaxID=1208656 RepID=A0ABP1W5I1_9ENTR|nr:hypothetical protein BN134_1147 [Cronobacter dublinensis 1210]CCJ85484.1 hypothetical protein BN133_1861 [Cronobacter dublinensis 582]
MLFTIIFLRPCGIAYRVTINSVGAGFLFFAAIQAILAR